MTDLELVEARWRVGHILTSELGRVADDLRAAGHDVPALAELTGIGPRDLRIEARQTFERALRELGGGGMSANDAALVLARRWAALLLDGGITPRQGAKATARLRFKGGAELDAHLLVFAELDARYDETKERRIRRRFTGDLDRTTRTQARRLLDDLRGSRGG